MERDADSLIGRSVQTDQLVNSPKGEVAGAIKRVPVEGKDLTDEVLYLVAWNDGDVSHHSQEEMAAVVGQKDNDECQLENAKRRLEISDDGQKTRGQTKA